MINDELKLVKDEYNSLRKVLIRALLQAKVGKGLERHATPGVPFEKQPAILIARDLGSAHFLLGQGIKKAVESARLPTEAAVRELLGAVVYLASAVIMLEGSTGSGFQLEPQSTEGL